MWFFFGQCLSLASHLADAASGQGLCSGYPRLGLRDALGRDAARGLPLGGERARRGGELGRILENADALVSSGQLFLAVQAAGNGVKVVWKRLKGWRAK